MTVEYPRVLRVQLAPPRGSTRIWISTMKMNDKRTAIPILTQSIGPEKCTCIERHGACSQKQKLGASSAVV